MHQNWHSMQKSLRNETFSAKPCYGYFGILGHLCSRLFKRPQKHQSSSNPGYSKRQLEGDVANSPSAVLSSDTPFYMDSQKSWRTRRRTSSGTTTKPAREQEIGRDKTVPTLTLQQRYHIAIPIQSGILDPLFGMWLPRIESEYPVNVYVVDPQGLADYQKALPFGRYDTAEGVTTFYKSLRLAQGTYYLLVSNSGNQPTALHYVVS